MIKEKIKKEKQKQLFSSYNRRELLAYTTSAEMQASKILTLIGVKHIRQYPIFTGRKVYYADIYIPTLQLVLEIDGGYHYTNEQKRKDRNRSSGIRRLGYHIFRLSNRDAKTPTKLIAKIRALIAKK